MINKLIEFLKENIDAREIEHASSKIWEERVPLSFANYNLYTNIIDLIDEFILDNGLYDNWFEDTGLDIEGIFDKLIAE